MPAGTQHRYSDGTQTFACNGTKNSHQSRSDQTAGQCQKKSRGEKGTEQQTTDTDTGEGHQPGGAGSVKKQERKG